ncbi:serine hydrolase [Antrihabitans sp. YC2-6]|uniref:serine hydrolase n=1 Tax=Antrihabitans sp. YC2-6 TaxID=2799498 RepID=UPI0018F30435|nr:serine hydrolase [Antrihabitans sp. YC2-6]MBJ8348900.1 serine hydrolase [Antrihabitans sp. YC2-6]
MRAQLALLAAVVLLVGCSSGSDETAAAPSSSDLPPNEVAAVPLPGDGVDIAVSKLDDLVKGIMDRTGIPGIAVSVVHDGKVVYAKGFGVKDNRGDDPVDADTVFQIASFSKSISATVVAHEVSEGKITWATPVAQLVPSVRLADPWVSDHVTVGDFFSHRSGLPGAAGDLLEDLGYDRQYIFEHLRLLPLNPFRITYAYANFGLTAGAEAAASAAGTDWATLADEAIYKPLGMASTSSRYADFEKRPNRAVLHMYDDGKFVPMILRDPDQQAPAGGVSSSVNDLARWMQLVLADGTYEGKQIFKPESLLPAVTPEMVSSRAKNLDERSSFYGFGFNTGISSSGRTTLNHSGAFVSGASTTFTLIPSANVGIAVLTNGAPIGVPETINASFGDLVQFGEIREDWENYLTKALAPLTAPVGSLAGEPRPTDPNPAKPLTDYVGSYANDYWGAATISEKDGNLVLALGPGGRTFPLTHWDGDTFTFTLLDENAPPGTISKATFTDNRLNLEYYDGDGLGTFVR